jgi:hypothetical protein
MARSPFGVSCRVEIILYISRQNLGPENAKINASIIRGDQTDGIKAYLPITLPTR